MISALGASPVEEDVLSAPDYSASLLGRRAKPLVEEEVAHGAEAEAVPSDDERRSQRDQAP
jgi:hypothetical protein